MCVNIYVLNIRYFTNEKVGAKLINSMTNNTQNNQGDWKNREVGALWKKAAANGKSSFCTGYIVSDELGNKVKQRVIMFANKTKSNEKSPDFIFIYLVSKRILMERLLLQRLRLHRQSEYRNQHLLNLMMTASQCK